MLSFNYLLDCLIECVENDCLLLLTQKRQVWRAAFSPDGNLLAVGCVDGHVYVYGQTNGIWAQVYNKHHSGCVCYFSLYYLC